MTQFVYTGTTILISSRFSRVPGVKQEPGIWNGAGKLEPVIRDGAGTDLGNA